MMRQRLAGADALAFHTETRAAPAHVLLVITLEASARLGHAPLRDLVASSLPGLAKFRSRLVGKPLGLGQPVWAQVDGFDPADHIHPIAVAPPGGRGEFADLVAKLITRPLDRDRPLWQVWTIEGLQGDRWALVLKLSPSMIDGPDGLSAILERLLTAAPDDARKSFPVEPGLGAPPSVVDLVVDTAAELAANQIAGLRLASEVVPQALTAATLRLRGGDNQAVAVARTTFDEPLTKRREVAFGSFPVADVEAVADAFDVTTDDVLLTCCALSLRAWFTAHEALPTAPLVMQTPVGRVGLPMRLDDPAEVLEDVHSQTQRVLTGHASNGQHFSAALTLPAVAQLLPPSVVQAGVRLYAGLGLSGRRAPASNGAAARFTGPPVQMYCAATPVVAVHTVPPLRAGAGVAITLTSYAGAVDVSVTVCPDRVCQVEQIADGIIGAVAALRRSCGIRET